MLSNRQRTTRNFLQARSRPRATGQQPRLGAINALIAINFRIVGNSEVGNSGAKLSASDKGHLVGAVRKVESQLIGNQSSGRYAARDFPAVLARISSMRAASAVFLRSARRYPFSRCKLRAQEPSPTRRTFEAAQAVKAA